MKNSEFVGLYFQLDSESVIVGKAAIGNMLGGIGYFYGQSKILLPRDPNVSNLNFFYILYISCDVRSLYFMLLREILLFFLTKKKKVRSLSVASKYLNDQP